MNQTAMRHKINTITKYILVFLMGILVIDVVWQVFSRYVLQSPSSFTDELARYIMIWVSLLGASYFSGQNVHISIDVLPNRLSPSNRFKLQLFIKVLIIAFVLSVLVIGGGYYVYLSFIFQQVTSSLGISMFWIYLIGPLSGLLILYYKISDIRLMLNDPDEYMSTPQDKTIN